METEKALFCCRNVSMFFPGVKALDDVNFTLYPGEVHGLVGRNGAGKSTLVNIIYGNLQPSSGSLYLEGKKIVLNNPLDGLRVGITLVPQEPVVFPNLTILENLAQPEFFNSNTFIKWNSVAEQCQRVLKKLNIDVDCNKLISELSLGQQQLISVGKAFFINNAKVVLLDEVTTSISIKDKELLYSMIEQKKKEGGAIVFITHNIKEIFEICDRITVMKDGKRVVTEYTKNMVPDDVIKAMFGENYKPAVIEALPGGKARREELLSVENLTRVGEFEKVSFNLMKNEILGLVGLRGAGKSELLQTIVGIREPLTGKIKYCGKEITIKSPSEALENGIVYLPEDREKDGLISILSVADNLTLSALNNLLGKLGFINTKQEIKEAEHLVGMFHIKTPSLDQQVMYLSGGNKQKVLIGRLYENKPKLYLLDEPTRGIDIEAKQEILRIIRQELVKDASVIVTSPELEDLLTICDRLVVLFEGKVAGILEKPFDAIKLYGLMQGISA